MDRSGDAYVDGLRAQHRSQPLAFFDRLLQEIWRDRSAEEAAREWARLCRDARWYAEDALWCIAYVLADPPRDLVERMQEHGWIKLDHGPRSDTPMKQYLDWLAGAAAAFGQLYAAQDQA